jgi:trans-aconitate methyltransferase
MGWLRDRLARARGTFRVFLRTLAPASRRAYFDGVYAARADPWNLDSPDYQRTRWKYDLILERLPRPRFERVLEIGCGNGNFTALLAPRCDRLEATDISAQAVELARRRVPDAHVTFERSDITDAELARDAYDLIVAQEVLFYVPWHRAWSLSRRLAAALRPGGTLVVVELVGGAVSTVHHWLLPLVLRRVRAEIVSHPSGRRYRWLTCERAPDSASSAAL